MVYQFTLKKSNSSNIKRTCHPINRQSGNPAVRPSGKLSNRQTGTPSKKQSVLKIFFTCITFFIVAAAPSFQSLKAENCKSKCPESPNRCDIDTTPANCTRIGNYYEDLQAAKERENNASAICESRCSGHGDPTTKGHCVSTCMSSIQQKVQTEESNLKNLIDRIHQEQEGDTESCIQAVNRLNDIELPPGCRGSRSSCRTDAEKCRGLLGQIGAGQGLSGLVPGSGSVGIQQAFQTRLSTQCPQAAAAKFEDDDRRLQDLTNDFDQAQDRTYELQKEMQDGIEEVQERRASLEQEIQQITNGIKQAAAEFERKTAAIQQNLSGQAAQLRSQVVQKNRQIRQRITELERIQNNDNSAADQALAQYKGRVREIFTQCDQEARQAAERLRGQVNSQVKTGTVRRLEDATKKGRRENLRQAAIRAYARCRNSQTTQNQVQTALEQYRLEQRAIARKEQEIVDEIDSLTEEVEDMKGAAASIGADGQRAYQAEQTEYTNTLQSLNNELQLKNAEKQRLDANFIQRHQQLNVQLQNERTKATQLNGELATVRQSVEVGRPTSAFGRLDYGQYDSLNKYEREFRSAKATCCSSGQNPDHDICKATSAGSFLKRGSGVR